MVGFQLIVAVLEPTVIVSVVPVGVARTTEPLVPVIEPWNAWARAGCGDSAAVASAADAQDIISALRRARCGRRAAETTVWVIGSSMARAGW